MKNNSLIAFSFLVLFACNKEATQTEKFSNFLKTIPELEIPFTANSYEDLQSKLYIDTLYKEFNDEYAHRIYGKTKISDSIYAVIYLLAGDNVFPKIITYNAIGKKISELPLVHLPGGSDGYNGNGSSFMTMDKNFEIQITDTLNSFERDSLDVIIEDSRKTTITKEKYVVSSNGEILKND